MKIFVTIKRVPDPVIEKARRLLGFEPRVGLDDGLQRTLAWFKSGKECCA